MLPPVPLKLFRLLKGCGVVLAGRESVEQKQDKTKHRDASTAEGTHTKCATYRKWEYQAWSRGDGCRKVRSVAAPELVEQGGVSLCVCTFARTYPTTQTILLNVACQPPRCQHKRRASTSRNIHVE